MNIYRYLYIIYYILYIIYYFIHYILLTYLNICLKIMVVNCHDCFDIAQAIEE